MSKVLLSGFLIFALAGGQGLQGQDASEKEKRESTAVLQHEVTVTANRIETPLKETGSSVTVITREELERSGKTTVIEALEEVAQLHLLRNGPAGSQSAIQIRGSESQHVKILIDGVEINDPVTPTRTVNLAHLMVGNISRIEIVAGPQSTLYGSDAMGGVINILTREETGSARVRLSSQGGSYETMASTAELSGGGRTIRYNLGFNQVRSGGFSAAGSRYDGNSEKDGCRNLNLFGKLGVSLQKNIDLRFSIRFTDADTDIDNFGGDYGDDPNNKESSRSLILNGEVRGRFWDHRWESLLKAAALSHDRGYNNPVDELNPFDSDTSTYKSGLIKLDWQNTLFLHESNTLTFGVEHTREQGESEYHSMGKWGPYDSIFPKKSADDTGLYLQDHLRLGGFFSMTAGGRWDIHSQAEGALTYRVAPALWIESTGTRLKASLGTGFKAPSLYQLYAPGTLYGAVGNRDLRAEESTGWDAGIEQSLLGGRLVLESVYFDNRFNNLIDYDTVLGYNNIAEASTRGFEFLMRARPIDTVTLQAAYVGTRAEDETTGKKLIRRPDHKLTARVGWRVTPRADISFSLIHFGERDDNFYQGYTSIRIPLDAYTLINAVASYRLLDSLRLFVRLDNLLNQEYEVIKGYGTPGFSAFGGVQLDF